MGEILPQKMPLAATMALLIFSLLGDAKINIRYVMSKEAMRGNF
jgi:hypothetical protein